MASLEVRPYFMYSCRTIYLKPSSAFSFLAKAVLASAKAVCLRSLAKSKAILSTSINFGVGGATGTGATTAGTGTTTGGGTLSTTGAASGVTATPGTTGCGLRFLSLDMKTPYKIWYRI